MSESLPVIESRAEWCKTCRFADTDGLDGLICRRNPPLVQMYTINREHFAESWWPEVEDDDWCGEWKAKDLRHIFAESDPRQEPLPARREGH